MSAFVIRETTNNKHYSTQLKTRLWLVSSRNVLTGCESEASDCPCKVGIAPLYRNSLCTNQHWRLLFQVQEIILRKMRCTQSNIWTVLEQCCKYNLTTDFYLCPLLEAQTKYFCFHNETQRLQDMAPVAATIPSLFIAYTFGWCFAIFSHPPCLNEPF